MKRGEQSSPATAAQVRAGTAGRKPSMRNVSTGVGAVAVGLCEPHQWASLSVEGQVRLV
jgi:hypothetical protein